MADHEEEENVTYENPLVYQMWIENFTINVHEGGTVILQTGQPNDPPPPDDPPAGSGD